MDNSKLIKCLNNHIVVAGNSTNLNYMTKPKYSSKQFSTMDL